MPGTWWSQTLLGFFFGIGLAVGTALIRAIVSAVAGHIQKSPS